MAKAQQHESGATHPLPNHEVAKVLIASQEHPARAMSEGKHGLISASAVRSPDFSNVVACGAQKLDNPPIDVLVGKKVHAAVAGSPKMISSRFR